MKCEYPDGFDEQGYEILNIVFDLLVGNPIKGCYNMSHNDLTAMVDEVNEDTNTIRLIDQDTQKEFSLMLTQVYAPAKGN